MKLLTNRQMLRVGGGWLGVRTYQIRTDYTLAGQSAPLQPFFSPTFYVSVI